jgi:hypothetical membrane protein
MELRALNRRNLKISGAAGIVSASLYIASWIIGAILRPGFSTQRQAVSELIEAGAPNKLLLDVMIFGFHLLVIPFAYGLHKGIDDEEDSKAGLLLLVSAGALGTILTLFFPCDPGCEPVTLRGTMHIVLAIPLGFLILFAILAFSRKLSRDKEWVGYGSYSLITFAGGLAAGILAAVFAKSSIGGILERLVGIAYQQWYVVMGLALIRRGTDSALLPD